MSDRKQQILEVAAELLQTKGFSGFSYADLSVRLGITKASIHHHFPSKSDLGLSLVGHFGEILGSHIATLDQNSQRPQDRLDGYFALAENVLHSGHKICPAGCLQADYNNITPAMQEALEVLCDKARAWLAGVLEDGRSAGVWAFRGSASDQALCTMAAVQGALMLSRAHGATSFHAVLRQLRESLRPK